MSESNAQFWLGEFDKLISKRIPRNCSADAYVFCDAGQLRLGVAVIEFSTTATFTSTPEWLDAILGQEDSLENVDGVGLFETEMYVSEMHGGHGGGKTSSFKRCLFLKNIGDTEIANCLITAIDTRPSPLCYLHLLHGGGAIGDLAVDATAFGCRDWDFACVIAGVWPRDHDGTEDAHSAVQ